MALPETVIQRLPRGTTYGYPDTVAADVLIVPGIDTLRRVWSQVKDQDVAVLVFDADVRLQSWRIPMLDLTAPLGKQLKSANTIKYQVRNPIKKLLSKTAKSFVSNFVTLTYKNRDLEKQAALRKEVFGALWRGERLKLVGAINKKTVELLALLNSEDAATLETALQEVKSGKKVALVAKAHKLSTFDLNYVVKFQQKG
jgi:hypothetical protein